MKYTVGMDYSFKGVVEFEVEADNEKDAEKKALVMAEEYAADHLSCGNGNFDCDCEELYLSK